MRMLIPQMLFNTGGQGTSGSSSSNQQNSYQELLQQQVCGFLMCFKLNHERRNRNSKNLFSKTWSAPRRSKLWTILLAKKQSKNMGSRNCKSFRSANVMDLFEVLKWFLFRRLTTNCVRCPPNSSSAAVMPGLSRCACWRPFCWTATASECRRHSNSTKAALYRHWSNISPTPPDNLNHRVSRGFVFTGARQVYCGGVGAPWPWTR